MGERYTEQRIKGPANVFLKRASSQWATACQPLVGLAFPECDISVVNQWTVAWSIQPTIMNSYRRLEIIVRFTK